MNEIILTSFSSNWPGFAVALLIEIVVLGVPCVAVASRSAREWLARLTDPGAEVRLGWGEWLGLAVTGLTFPGLGLLTLARLPLAAAPRAWRRRQIALAWLCAGVGAFGFLVFALVYGVFFSGPVRSLGLANLAAGVIGMPLVGAAFTLVWLVGRRPDERAHAA